MYIYIHIYTGIYIHYKAQNTYMNPELLPLFIKRSKMTGEFLCAFNFNQVQIQNFISTEPILPL